MKSIFPKQRLIFVGIMVAWCTLLVMLRFRYKTEPLFASLWWNIFLAIVPLLCSTVMRWTAQGRKSILAIPCFVVWILFLPNAPYILTDLFHLKDRPPVPLWLDLAMLLSFAGAGLMLCYLSLTDVHSIVQRKFGMIAGWAVACSSLMLCGLGIYLGRYLRFNSWYVITHPGHLFHKSLYRIGIDQTLPNVYEVTLVFGVGLIVGYLVLNLFTAAMEDRR